MNIDRKVVLVVGNSVFLEGIAEILRTQTHLQVLQIKVHENVLTAQTKADVILVDASQVSPSDVEEIIAAFPTAYNPTVIRLNADSQRLIVISARQYPAVSLNDLTQAIEKISQVE